MVFVVWISHANALMITEVMYDVEGTDTDREWVEIFNDTEDTIDLSQYRFNDGANHVLNAPPANGGQGSLTFQPQQYAILAANAEIFLNEHPGFSGTVIDTVMNLTNTGDMIALMLGTVSVASHTYTSDDGAAGDGHTLQYIDGIWTESSASPGLAGVIENNEPPPSDSNTQTTNTTPSSHEALSAKEKERISELRKQFVIDFSSLPKTGVAGGTLTMKTLVANAYKETYAVGRFVWSMGDGAFVERSDDDPFSYVYMYPGEYVVTMDFYKKTNTGSIPEKTARKIITITAPNIRIGSIDSYGSVEIVNDSSEEREIGGWRLSCGSQQFVFPLHTILLPKKKLYISSRISGLSLTSQSVVVLMNENRDVIASYTTSPSKKLVDGIDASLPLVTHASISDTSQEIAPQEIRAADQTPKKKKEYSSVIALLGIIILGSTALIVSRRLRTKDEVIADDDFELIE